MNVNFSRSDIVGIGSTLLLIWGDSYNRILIDA